MQSLPFYVVGFVACIVCIGSHAYAIDGGSVEHSKVLENLRNYDSVYESGFTVSGTWQRNDMMILGRLYLDVKRRWRLTFGGDRVGYLLEVIDYEKPKYQRPGRSRFKLEQPKQPGQQGPDLDDTLRIPIRTRQWGYWGRDLSGNHYEDTVVSVTPAGKVTETGKMYDSSLFRPRDESPNAQRQTVLWSLGRFFSQYLTKVTKVEESTDGRFVVSALGKKSGQQSGRWELEIEPAAAWMVRKARFYGRTEPDRIEMEMRNEGTVWSGPYCIPKETVINYWGPIRNDTETVRRTGLDLLTGGPEHLTFDPAVEKFDEQLYSIAEQAVAHNRTPSLTVHDHRVSPPIISEPFRPKRTQPLRAEPGSTKKWWFIAVNLVVIFALLAILGFRRYRTRHKDAPGK